MIERLYFLAFLPGLQILMQASEHWDVLMSWKQALPLAYWNLRAIRLSRPLDLPLLPFGSTTHKCTALSNMCWAF